MIAVRAFEGIRFGESVFLRGKGSGADLAQELSFGAVVFVKKRFGSITSGTGAAVINVTHAVSFDRFDGLPVLPFEIRDVVSVIPFFVEDNLREFIDFELLVFWRMGIIESPLFERKISADKI